MFSVIIPIFNESQNIINLLDEINKSLIKYQNYEIILINDCSTDNTVNIISKINNNKIKLISNNKNLGQSYSIHKGINFSSNKTIVTIDGDGQNDPADIPNLLDIYFSTNEVELVGGLRTKRQDSVIKKLSSIIANNIRSKILNDNCKDTGCSLKVFNKQIFLSFPYFDGIHRFLPALFSGYGFKTIFVKVNHRKRKYGVSKYGTINRLFIGIKDIIRVKKIIKEKKHV